MSSFLRAKIELQLGSFALDIDLAFEGATSILAGPNGAGKSSFLAALLGLRKPDRGAISLDDSVLFDSARAIDLAPEQRGFGWVPQGPSLFPHLSAQKNIELAIESRHPDLSRNERRDRARALLERLGAIGLADRMPSVLSGGEEQRIALARAIASEPRMLLLDEPLSALDARARPSVREFLSATLPSLKLPALVVTHDPIDAQALGGQIFILENGRALQSGSLAELRAAPQSAFVQTFAQGLS